MRPSARDLEVLIDRALEEDSVGADVTTSALIPPHLEARALLVPQEPGILAGLDVAASTFKRIDPELQITLKLLDGDRLDGFDSYCRKNCVEFSTTHEWYCHSHR